ncbi:hypothetical protein Droror1_Dr00027418 [Drosera rotundifolia]
MRSEQRITRAKDLLVQLAEAQEKMEEKLKERDDNYSELNSRFSKLHKRAKQRIQGGVEAVGGGGHIAFVGTSFGLFQRQLDCCYGTWRRRASLSFHAFQKERSKNFLFWIFKVTKGIV